jgi:hypothetical protein
MKGTKKTKDKKTTVKKEKETKKSIAKTTEIVKGEET